MVEAIDSESVGSILRQETKLQFTDMDINEIEALSGEKITIEDLYGLDSASLGEPNLPARVSMKDSISYVDQFASELNEYTKMIDAQNNNASSLVRGDEVVEGRAIDLTEAKVDDNAGAVGCVLSSLGELEQSQYSWREKFFNVLREIKEEDKSRSVLLEEKLEKIEKRYNDPNERSEESRKVYFQHGIETMQWTSEKKVKLYGIASEASYSNVRSGLFRDVVKRAVGSIEGILRNQ